MDSKETQTDQTETTEIQIARLSVKAVPRYLKTVVDLVADLALACGLAEDRVRTLDTALFAVCRHTLAYGYAEDPGQLFHVVISRRSGSFVVALEDQGLPFHYQRVEQGKDPHFATALSQGGVDQVRFLNLGRGGNRTELIWALPGRDMHDSEEVAHRTAAAPRDEALSLRMMEPGEAVELARAVYRSYGYSYESDFVYSPEHVRARQQAGLMKSCVVYNAQGEMVGHLALHVERPQARVAESGLAVVDPRYRGRQLFKKMKLFLRDYAAAHHMVGLYSEAVTAHPYSQLGNISLGAHEIGYLLGGSPHTVFYRGISEGPKTTRQSIALMYLPVLDSAPMTVHVPEVYRQIVERVYTVNGLTRTLASDQRDSPAQLPSAGQLTVQVHPDTSRACVSIASYGRDTLAAVQAQRNQLCLQRIECISLDLPLSHPATQSVAEQCRQLGFFLGGVMPELAESGDVLRLQYLNNVAIVPNEICVVSEFGRSLLERILKDRAAVAG